ncbi:hypothetical protein AC249_AIPGENE4611 [Exaiptasia diaphana]|nr:hypothetical protein AC249_AIPGENE4611 [Exaiptasia diaphana]
MQLDCPLEDLQEDTAYFVKVYAKNQQANGLDSTVQEFTTKASKTSLMWLWVFLPLCVILVIAGIVICYRKTRRNDNYYDKNPNKPTTHAQKVKLYSFKNEAFSLSAVNHDLGSFGMMPGKWWEIPRESLQLQEKLGSGAFGMVQKAQLRVENAVMTCAVKMLQIKKKERERGREREGEREREKERERERGRERERERERETSVRDEIRTRNPLFDAAVRESSCF